MNNLYEITKEHLEIFSDLEDADGEVLEELAQRLEINDLLGDFISQSNNDVRECYMSVKEEIQDR